MYAVILDSLHYCERHYFENKSQISGYRGLE